jgi:very-short-patch-repair endonuclease
MLPEVDRMVPSIVAVRERRTTGARLLSALDGMRHTPGAAEMRKVFQLAAAGCHSPLELWGHEQVFTHPELPSSRCQVPVDLPTGRIYLDRYYEMERLDVELDGAAYHGEPGQRERDNRRDAALAALGIQVVRFSHPRLHGDPAGVRRQIREILVMRRQQLRLSA